MNTFTTQANAMIGRNVNVNGAHHVISGLAEQTGKLKNGEVAQYINLTDDNGEVITLNPRKAAQLFSKGEIEGIQMLVDAIVAETAVAGAALVEVEAKMTPTEIICYPTEEVKKEKKAKVVKEVVAKAPSKKEKCIAAYNAVMADETVAAGDKRKVTIALFMAEEIGLSKPGSATYFQSCKSGQYA